MADKPIVVKQRMGLGQKERDVVVWSFVSDLMMDPITKQSSDFWKRASEIYVIREDRLPLSIVQFEFIISYCFNLYATRPTFVPTPEDFACFCVQYRDDVLRDFPSDSKELRYRVYKDIRLPL
ncbi:hypothetical protein PENSPDRAFT_682110 [Peniophora sp. CONT]|nr:hypothetical protein PENSPDRAFT_682110 [Peniophora sp. CONT]